MDDSGEEDNDSIEHGEYAFDNIERQLETLVLLERHKLFPRDRHMLYIDVNSTIATLNEKLDREYLHLIASLFGPKHLEIISRDMEKKDRGLRLAATSLIVFCIQYGFAYGLANNSQSFEDAAGHEVVEKIYDPYVLNLRLFINRSNVSSDLLCNFIVVKKGDYYEKITNQWDPKN